MIATELEREFVDYEYIEITKWLQRNHKLPINRMNVYRQMSKHRLLKRRPKRSTIRKQWIREMVPNPAKPLTHHEFEMKIMPVHGCRRNVSC